MQTTIYVISRKEIQVCNLQELYDTVIRQASDGVTVLAEGNPVLQYSIFYIED